MCCLALSYCMAISLYLGFATSLRLRKDERRQIFFLVPLIRTVTVHTLRWGQFFSSHWKSKTEIVEPMCSGRWGCHMCIWEVPGRLCFLCVFHNHNCHIAGRLSSVHHLYYLQNLDEAHKNIQFSCVYIYSIFTCTLYTINEDRTVACSCQFHCCKLLQLDYASICQVQQWFHLLDIKCI